jgi:hypothetical protein
MSLYECDRDGCEWKNQAWRYYGFADAGMAHAMHMDKHRETDDELEDDECPDCGPRSECLACGDDRRFSEERDRRCEEGL